MQKLPPFFALTSLRPDGTHFYLGDYDSYNPHVDPSGNCWKILTSPNSYHVINFRLELTLRELLAIQKNDRCDPLFIRATRKNKFAQVSIDGLVIKTGERPTVPLRFIYVHATNSHA